ncbi:hypothetical protein Barb6_01998 [Bacteroidales bacterium Barb6]|nr:hypothetical protein Barb6_01998 [Bacteroidales bacterium Barb6]
MALYAHQNHQFTLSPDSIALTLVGILATFIVISNYIQVKEIENGFERKIEATKDELKEEFEKIVGREMEEYNHNVSACLFMLNGYLRFKDNKIEDSLRESFNALIEMNQSKNKYQLDTAIDNIESILSNNRFMNYISKKTKLNIGVF